MQRKSFDKIFNDIINNSINWIRHNKDIIKTSFSLFLLLIAIIIILINIISGIYNDFNRPLLDNKTLLNTEDVKIFDGYWFTNTEYTHPLEDEYTVAKNQIVSISCGYMDKSLKLVNISNKGLIHKNNYKATFKITNDTIINYTCNRMSMKEHKLIQISGVLVFNINEDLIYNNKPIDYHQVVRFLETGNNHDEFDFR